MKDPRLRGLYAITPARLCTDPAQLMAAVDAALRGGARLIQYRDKHNDAPTRQGNALELLGLCRSHQAELIINDDVALARTIGTGVHLGANDLPVRQARARLGADAIIGVSCANALDRALKAEAEGASYIAFGRFFLSRTKPDAPQAELSLLRIARARLRIPICAIGGITAENAVDPVESGADLVAAVEGVFGEFDIEATARAYAGLFDQ
jgi:thiamine-phosphate pyrophosphorylase